MNPEAAMRERIRAIMSNALARRMPALANHLAFETNETAESGVAAMRAFAADLDRTNRLH